MVMALKLLYKLLCGGKLVEQGWRRQSWLVNLTEGSSSGGNDEGRSDVAIELDASWDMLKMTEGTDLAG
jgi:hypothetical protein